MLHRAPDVMQIAMTGSTLTRRGAIGGIGAAVALAAAPTGAARAQTAGKTFVLVHGALFGGRCGAAAKFGYNHGTVHHGAKQYVVGAIHTNTIEGFWSIFKRAIVRSFHKVSKKYMPLYVADFQFRYNNRQNAEIFGTAIAGC